MNRDKIKVHRIQFRECEEQGYTKETEFWSFEKHPELMPAFPTIKIEDVFKI
jgi:hypothetical protein